MARLAVFASFMTRHHDGHQREYWARFLCERPSYWAAPYLAALLGDYVIQVLDAVRDTLSDEWKPIMKRYAEENQISLRALNHRILNYWTIYYGFDQDKCSNASESQRYFMAKYLIDEKVLIGKTKDDVSNLLGEASRDSTAMMLYKPGSERSSIFAVDDDWLEITFDGAPARLLVVSTRIRPD